MLGEPSKHLDMTVRCCFFTLWSVFKRSRRYVQFYAFGLKEIWLVY